MLFYAVETKQNSLLRVHLSGVATDFYLKILNQKEL